METKICESCGMPMKTAEDFGGGNTQNAYCTYCTDEQGNLKPYDEKLADFKNFLMKTQGLEELVALEKAKETMSKLPAWKNIN